MNFLKKTPLLASVLLATQLVCSQEAISVSGVVQHPFEFQTLSNPGLTTVNLTAVPYPNPTKDFIILKVSQKNKSLKTFKINKHQ
jgi:hypothetical protein